MVAAQRRPSSECEAKLEVWVSEGNKRERNGARPEAETMGASVVPGRNAKQTSCREALMKTGSSLQRPTIVYC
nr:hypothetical protein CFP56_62157 [Quercus suber]